MKRMVNVVCDDCRGTGLYEGFLERSGHPVVCLGCDGTGGNRVPTYSGRKRKRGVKSVAFRASKSIAVDGESKRISYAEFLRKVKSL